MHKYRLSKWADSDIAGIADYTIRQFGIKQARRYRDGLEKIFRRLAEYPNSGRSAGHLASRLAVHPFKKPNKINYLSRQVIRALSRS